MLRHKRLLEAAEPQVQQRRSYRQDLQTPVRQQQQEELDEDEFERMSWRKAAQMLSDSDEYLQTEADERNQLLRAKAASQTAPAAYRDEDDASSISFAQSGCHSILSAWRLKSTRRSRQDQHRPLSVLSNGSSVATRKSAATSAIPRGKSPASATRIPLGPRQAQHFVTNSRRRRRANELILSTMEARRRAQLALSQQNASLLGSASYLAGEEPLLADYAAGRLSLSPSPVSARAKTPSPAPRARPALSDLGARATSAAAQAQRNRLLLNASSSQSSASRQKQQKRKQVPLAKLDQNSSDLYSSNSSSADSSSSSDSSSGSQFTQLVTCEMAPGCGLLVEQALRDQRRPPAAANQAPAKLHTPTSKPEPPKVAERQRRKQRSPVAAAPADKRKTEASVNDADSEAASGKLRRGALRRDSIRRLRLNRAPTNQHEFSDLTPSSDTSSSQQQQQQQQRQELHRQQQQDSHRLTSRPEVQQRPVISRRRSPDLESNPFLNRHHIRASSVRATRHSEPEQSSPKEPERRGAWALFGLTPKGGEHRVEPPPKPRFFAEARRASSSETVREPSAQRASQAPQSSEPQMRQVERMLRQMQPNQVFTSYAREHQATKSLASSVDRPTNSVPMRSSASSGATKPTVAARVRPPSQQSSHSQQQQQQQRESPNREVREGSRAKLEDRVDVAGNRRQLELAESWRLEKSGPQEVSPRRQVSEQRLVSERMELIRSSNISPPIEFADHHQRAKPEAPAASSPRSPVPPAPIRATSVQREPVAPIQRFSQRSLSEERPQVAARKRPTVAPSPPPTVEPMQQKAAAPREPQVAAKLTAKLTASLPQFERTADDEFRKRVDYLRKLARANLSQPDQPPARKQPAQPLTKPMSTNWRQQVTEQEVAMREQPRAATSSSSSRTLNERTKWILGSQPATQVAAREPATTNLDALLADHRYQLPVAASKWGRSNSSLASIGAERTDAHEMRPPAQPRPRPTSPVASDAGSRLTERSVSSRAPSQCGSAVMKLVVKEKSAPRLDYAFVEQQPVVQRAVLPPMQAPQRQSQPQVTRSPPQQPPLQLTTRSPPKPAIPQQQPATRVRSPLRVASPRSPEFGALAASSNDDSAIASSVSSPSLSFMMNGEQQRAAGRATSPVGVARVLRPRLALGSDSSPSALQSILRRHQQAGDSSDSSQAVSSPSNEPTAPVSRRRPQEQPQEPLFRSDARSPEPRLSAMRPLSPLSQAASTSPQQQQQQQSSPPKRVHFNDRTSIRSFESVSSLASNSTAVANNDLLRQQVGSPDSVGSGSTGRLSAESPDLRKGSGAAIYAIRGDPELELPEPPTLHSGQAAGSYGGNPSFGQSYSQSGAYIRMTAPPRISSAPAQHQIQYVARPTSLTSTHIVPTRTSLVLEDDEDPTYALRLRQAAAERVFKFAVPPVQPVQLSPRPAGQMVPQQPAHLSPQQHQVRARRPPNNLLNFQTEV